MHVSAVETGFVLFLIDFEQYYYCQYLYYFTSVELFYFLLTLRLSFCFITLLLKRAAAVLDRATFVRLRGGQISSSGLYTFAGGFRAYCEVGDGMKWMKISQWDDTYAITTDADHAAACQTAVRSDCTQPANHI